MTRHPKTTWEFLRLATSGRSEIRGGARSSSRGPVALGPGSAHPDSAGWAQPGPGTAARPPRPLRGPDPLRQGHRPAEPARRTSAMASWLSNAPAELLTVLPRTVNFWNKVPRGVGNLAHSDVRMLGSGEHAADRGQDSASRPAADVGAYRRQPLPPLAAFLPDQPH
jgi:hypothetical protein